MVRRANSWRSRSVRRLGSLRGAEGRRPDGRSGLSSAAANDRGACRRSGGQDLLPRQFTQMYVAGRATERLRASHADTLPTRASSDRSAVDPACRLRSRTAQCRDAPSRYRAQDGSVRRSSAQSLSSGSSNNPRSMSTCSQRRCKISRSRAPVKISSRSAAAACGEIKVRWFSSFARCFDSGFAVASHHAMPTVSPSRMAAPSRSSSSEVRKRSRRSSGNFSILLAGLQFSGTRPCRSAKV